ncbi:unnamed protein product [Rotaria sordida]|uniref:Uncharacterized protein n=1 Tax=Rotaria sordida TaxID=392033 RepID=A0A816A5R2_9BILA|nr:unnamed protein product [Rotaria sordida]CAF1591391.1 unnamed protein product [Rotaria sordida]
MSKRATASPKEAEEQRVVARKRSAARRAAYTPDELERQCASARQRKQLRKSGKHQQETVKTKVQESNDFEWPKPIDIEQAAENERASYIPDPLINTSEFNNTTVIPIISSAVLDFNGTKVSSDEVAEHLLERIKTQAPKKNTRKRHRAKL